ncbi:MAG: hypothetical protein MZV64_12760 [Ignavibacteriales bacterium]|nr:hypothetical protein [Ignavibacteriales bacterium]
MKSRLVDVDPFFATFTLLAGMRGRPKDGLREPVQTDAKGHPSRGGKTRPAGGSLERPRQGDSIRKRRAISTRDPDRPV